MMLRLRMSALGQKQSFDRHRPKADIRELSAGLEGLVADERVGLG